MTVIVTTRDGDTVTYPEGVAWNADRDYLMIFNAEKVVVAEHHGAAWSSVHFKQSQGLRTVDGVIVND